MQHLFYLCKMQRMDRTKHANQIIDALGGTGAVAELCDVKPAAVSQWRLRGIPATHFRWMKAKRLAKMKQLSIELERK